MSQPQQPAPPPPPPPSEPTMEPPAYTPALTATTRPHRNISDLRAQIIANGSVIRPRTDVNKSSDDHIELIVAKTPAPRPAGASSSSSANANPRLHYSEKEAMAALNRASDPMRSMHQPNRVAGASSRAGGQGGGGGAEGRHYAVLVKRSGNRTINVIVQGEPRDTVEEALEWMLERTECLMHDLVVRNGRKDPGDGCAVM